MFSLPPKMNSAFMLSVFDSMYADAWACLPRGREVDTPGHTVFFLSAPLLALLLMLLPVAYGEEEEEEAAVSGRSAGDSPVSSAAERDAAEIER